MSKVIEFTTSKFWETLSELEKPEPIKLHTPDWYKKLKHSRQNLTVKGCMPFLDTLIYGYVLKIPQDMHFKIWWNEEIKCFDAQVTTELKEYADVVNVHALNMNFKNTEVHPESQWVGAKWSNSNYMLPITKIINPWLIKTPPGWSCLFTPPLNNKDERFEILSGIVDTDVYDQWINFPGYFNSYKYPKGYEFVLKKGTPYCQIIPFKRENWKMKITYETPTSLTRHIINYAVGRFEKYKSKYWHKKSCN